MVRPPTGFRLAAFALLLGGAGASLFAESSALIVSGLSGSSENAEQFQKLAAEARAALEKRGIPRVEVLDGDATRDAILAKLRATGAGPKDEFWLVLYGISAPGRDGRPAFQVRGPRLTAEDLKAALDAIPARQHVFIGTSDSGGFVPALRDARRDVLAATAAGEGDQPRFAEAWTLALAASPDADFHTLAARAADAVDQQYRAMQLAQGEHARLADAGSDRVLEPPFGKTSAAPAAPPTAVAETSPGPLPSEIEVRKDSNPEWESHPATDETRKIMAEARALPNPEGYAAIVLAQRLGFTVEDDRTTDRTIFRRVYLAKDEAAAEWAKTFLPQNPPLVTSKLEIARVIHPDGSFTAFNPAKLPCATDPTSGQCTALAMAWLPGARAGCVVEIGSRTRQMLDATLPHVSELLPVQQSAPALDTELEVRVPAKPPFRVVLNHLDASPQVAEENGRKVWRWHVKNLAAAEPLPGDPPAQLWLASVGVSSLPSWDDFAAWYRRLADGSDRIDDSVRQTAKELAQGSKSRMETIRRDFEFVSALRYVAIEMGLQGFRPRTPAEVLANRYGDCKDKANLLAVLLRAQGIDADFVLLNRGSATDVNFPSWQFNHAICHVAAAPDKGQPGELWLDTTDSVTPFGFVPPGDYGRDGLVFAKDKAEFRRITGAAGATSEVRDEWTLEQTPDGGWRGDFHRQATGLADDAIRRAFRDLSPAQRRVALDRMLGDLWPAADFTDGRVSDVSALSADAELRARLTAPDGLPTLDPPGFEIFSAPDRDRPLWLNDAQPLVLEQTVTLHYAKAAPAALPEPWSAEAAGEKLGVRWEKIDARTLRRIARVELPRPIVPASDYAALRRAVRGWEAALRKETL
jgi:hypothetical protein